MEYYSAINRNEVLIPKEEERNTFRVSSSRMPHTRRAGGEETRTWPSKGAAPRVLALAAPQFHTWDSRLLEEPAVVWS